MKLLEIFRFELKYQLSRWSTWIYFLIFLGITTAMMLSFVDNARNGDYLLNAPIVIGAIISIASLLGILVSAAVAGDAATHDVQEGVEPLLYTSPLSKFTYLGGRFLGAFTVSAMVLTAVPIALMFAKAIPDLEASLFGPFSLTSYLNAYFLVALPNTFIITAILFVVALLSRNALVSFLVGAVLFMVGLTSKEVLADQMGMWELARLLDLSVFTIYGELRQSLPPTELNIRQVGLEKWLLLNRLLWLAVAIGVLVIAHLSFRFNHYVGSSWFKRLFKKKTVAAEMSVTAPIAVPQVHGEFTSRTSLYQLMDIAWRSLRESLFSWGWLAILGAVAFFLFLGPELLEGPIGVPRFPLTGLVINLYSFFPIKLLVVALISLYVGQVVWRERDARMGDISDATPVPDVLQLLGKFISVVLMLVLLHVAFMLAGILIQVLLGYSTFEIGLYLRVLLGLQLAEYLLFAAVAMAVHVLVNQKYMGHIIILLTFLYTAFAGEFGIRHNLLIYGASPEWSYSAISGFGATVGPWLLFKLYWAGWALLLAVLAKLFWVRGRETSFTERLQHVFVRPTQSIVLLGAAGVLLVISLGSFVLYNTNVLNKYHTPDELAERRAEYERRFGKYSSTPQPNLTATSLHVEIFPDKQEAVMNGVYTLKNKTKVSIDTVHLATAAEVETSDISFDRDAKIILADKALRHTIYTLKQPLQPGDSLELSFKIHFKQNGFTNDGIKKAVAENGTFFVAQDWLPAIGYQSIRELDNPVARSVHNLAPKPATPLLHDKKARYKVANRGRVRFSATLGTAADQLAIAPGKLTRSWTENGRRYFHYTADSPIRTMQPIFSAKYAVKEDKWKDVQIQIYHHPEHTQYLDRMMQSTKASLAYFTKTLGPYPHKQIKFVEYTRSGTSATSYPGTIAYTEGFAVLNPDADEREFDLTFAVVAHEIAHQWWAHQLIPASVEGAPVLSESLAWYSALGVVEETYGTEHLRRLLYVMRSSYLTPRSKADVPLLRATDEFLSYRKGPFAMHMLREYVGQERVNVALRNLLQKYSSGEPPLATTLDLYRELQAVTPDSLEHLLSDLFVKNTYWEIKTKEAQAQQLSDGKWQVTLEVQARKVMADEAGKVSELPLNDAVEVGAFLAGKDDFTGKEIYLQKHRIRSGIQHIRFVVPEKPVFAGIDPHNVLIDAQPYDNIKKTKIVEPVKLFGAVPVKQREQLMQYVIGAYL
ncbi:ABC transporter permease/M1 family aminopeptidase [Pontibacter cellulosilyticus]|uniref:ABC transporter permease n=1 Tax=Pontibacter cellulosilyticus TaxID=1720253 RepID=A0A923N914_9BACT|nr:M1 family aminopeptidase [Pontibacter cellulosilyticus]MBC5994461.1 ABC transporter permease [Pontibacter cellulosilyticus]